MSGSCCLVSREEPVTIVSHRPLHPKFRWVWEEDISKSKDTSQSSGISYILENDKHYEASECQLRPNC